MSQSINNSNQKLSAEQSNYQQNQEEMKIQDSFQVSQNKNQKEEFVLQQSGIGDDSDNQSDDSDFSDPRIQQMVDEQLKDLTYDQLIEEREDRKDKYHEKMKQLLENSERKWLREHGKKQYIDFDETERKELKKYFQSLDQDNSGGIGQDELEEPLISLGIADSREEVKKIIDAVDDDGNIEFKEFLIIIKGKEKRKRGGSSVQNPQDQVSSQKNQAIVKFFKNMINGKLGDGSISKSLPFELIVSSQRRKKIMAAIMEEKDQNKQKEGQKVMLAWDKLKKLQEQKIGDIYSSQQNKIKESSKFSSRIQSKPGSRAKF